MSQLNLNGAQLKKIANASHTAEVVMTDMALRERVRPFSDIHRTRNRLIREGEKIIEDDYKAFWKSLQDTGAGVIVYGRKGNPDRFQWHYSMKKVAEAALDGKDLKVSMEKPESPKSAPKAETKVAAKPVQTKEFCVPIRADFLIDLVIPANLTKAEAEMISAVLRRAAA